MTKLKYLLPLALLVTACTAEAPASITPTSLTPVSIPAQVLPPTDAAEPKMLLTGDLDHDEPIICAADFVLAMQKDQMGDKAKSSSIREDYAAALSLTPEQQTRLAHGCMMFNYGILFYVKANAEPQMEQGYDHYKRDPRGAPVADKKIK